MAKKTIRIITDANPSSEIFDKAESHLKDARRIYFLGFGFAPQNLERLRVFNRAWDGDDRNRCLVNGTVQGKSRPQWERIASQYLGSSWSTDGTGGGTIFTFFRDLCDLEADIDAKPLAFT